MKIRAPLLPRWLRWLAVAVVAGFVFYTSILTVPPETAVDTAKPSPVPLDKWRHFLAYAAVAGSLAYATVEWDLTKWQQMALVVGVTVVYGVGIEAWQSLIPNRYFSLGDAYANALGAVLVLPWFPIQWRLEFVDLAAAVCRDTSSP